MVEVAAITQFISELGFKPNLGMWFFLALWVITVLLLAVRIGQLKKSLFKNKVLEDTVKVLEGKVNSVSGIFD